MLAASAQRLERALDPGALVLDVGGWASPLARADWVIDVMPYETRGLYGAASADERFGAQTWVRRDICAREPWPFGDGQFDFAICSHTLEDVRDPVWVCSELERVARAGYVEFPSRLEEQSWGVVGEFVGWSHHRWLCELDPGPPPGIAFVSKPHALHANPEQYLTAELAAALEPPERAVGLFWEGSLPARERIFLDAEELDAYLAEPLVAAREDLGDRIRRPPLGARLRSRLRR